MNRVLYRALALAAVLAVLAAAPVLARDLSGGEPLTLDEEYALIAKQVPGFAGLYYDADGALNAVLTDPSAAASLQSLVGGTEIKVQQGDYDFLELVTFRDALNDVMSSSDVVLLDIDEGKNRIRIGIDEQATFSALSDLEGAVSRSAVPREAVVIERVPAIHFMNVRNRWRPVPGGVQIAFGSFVCTQGFTANRLNVRGYVTNSHCTLIQGGVEGTIHYQNTASSSNRIGVEQVDPNYTTGGGCPSGRRCRWSDSSWGRYDTASTGQFARIARTSGVGSLTTTSSNRFVITGVVNNPTLGQTLNKVGRTTGWSRGTVNTTCANINVSGTTITQRCQSLVGAAVGGGDSGSPVFAAGTSSANVNATLYGILWGGGGGSFAFSPWSGITRSTELGPLTVF